MMANPRMDTLRSILERLRTRKQSARRVIDREILRMQLVMALTAYIDDTDVTNAVTEIASDD